MYAPNTGSDPDRRRLLHLVVWDKHQFPVDSWMMYMCVCGTHIPSLPLGLRPGRLVCPCRTILVFASFIAAVRYMHSSLSSGVILLLELKPLLVADPQVLELFKKTNLVFRITGVSQIER